MRNKAISKEIQPLIHLLLKNQLSQWMVCLTIIVITVFFTNSKVTAQTTGLWTPEQRIPDYHPQTSPPLMVTDRNKTVHAFSSQLFDEVDRSLRVIVYNNWTLDRGWSKPVDIVLSPNKNEARVTGVYLDQKTGIVHLTFFGGDGTGANIYYAKAPVSEANQAAAWSAPIVVGEGAGDPELAAITGDELGNLAIIYSGVMQGRGLYIVYSQDAGESWTNPQPVFLTYNENFPVVFDLFPGETGLVHMVWDVRDPGGNGRQIYYANLDIEKKRWELPLVLGEAEEGYGILNPAIVEHENELFVAYSGIVFQFSQDGGKTWTEPAKPFIHTGVNGVMSFVVDSNSDLHLLWAQRISGSPDIHGVWHSTWQNGRWTEPEAVVSGPQVADFSGDRAFDPFDVHAVVSQGNVALATWRSDPGLKGNGVWFSYLTLDSPELPLQLPVTASITLSDKTPTVATIPEDHSASIIAFPTDFTDMEMGTPTNRLTFNSPVEFVFVGLVPVVFLILVVMMGTFYVSYSRR